MYELAIPGGLTVYPSPEPTESHRVHGAEGRLRHGLLFWVLAGHVGVIWLLQMRAEPIHDFIEPRVLRVSWIHPESRPETPVVTPAQAMPPKPSIPPRQAIAEAVPVTPPIASIKAAAAMPQPRIEAPHLESRPPQVEPQIPVAVMQEVVATSQDIAPTVRVAPPSAPVEVPVPPSFHADYLANPAPEYPPISRRMGEEGTVRLYVHVAANGLPLAVRIDASSGSPRLDRSALDAVATWRFVPARLGERAVSGWVVVPIAFALQR